MAKVGLSDDEMDALMAQAPAVSPASPPPPSAAPSTPKGLSDDEMNALMAAPTKAPAPEKGKLEAAMRGGAQGIAFGNADELTAGIGAVKDWTAGKLHLRGDIGLRDAYNSYIDRIRAEDAKAKADQPWTYGLAEAAGAIGSTAAGPGAAMAPVKGAGAAANAGRIFAGGAAMGAGLSEAPPTSPDFYKDAGIGGATGLATAGAMKAVGAAARAVTPTNLARKASNVLLNTPEEITDLYIKDPQKVRGAPTRFEVVQRYKDLLDKLKGDVTSGSAESRAILEGEGQVVKGSELRQIFRDRADAMEARAEGVRGDNPDREATIAWLRQMEDAVSPIVKTPPPGSRGRPIFVDRKLSTNRVKDMLQGLDSQTQWEVGPGKFGRIDDTTKKGVRTEIDELLKGRSDAYKDQMKQVSADTALLGDAAPLANNEGAMANVLRRIETDKYGGGQVPRDTLESFDKRMGSDILDQAKYAHAREAFDKSVTNGSRNVNLFSNMLKGVPIVGKVAGPVLGGTVDKYGRQMTMSAVDTAAALNKAWQTAGVDRFMSDIAPVVNAARRGDASAALTLQLLEKSNPHAARAAMSGDQQP